MISLRLPEPSWNHPLFMPLKKAVQKGTLIVFGSVADRTETGFSDVDLFWIHPDDMSSKEITRTLFRLSRIILKYDHLQHHAPFHASEKDAREHSPLPPEALEGAIVLKGNNEIILGGWDDGKTILERLTRSIINRSMNPPDNLYDLKSFLSWLFLIPALVFRTRGIGLSKKKALIRAPEIFENADILEPASHLRKIWPRPRSRLFSFVIDISPNPWRFNNHLARLMFKIPDELKKEIPDDFWERSRAYAEEALRLASR